ncbi:hypothetical protein AB0D46_24935 [Streptomyces sp. NPDC048383]|uniref:hypothetical protein n=1 Tax=Streptomyces sp. NPDC048383 TaxID=3155386 RepID=UPI003441B19D
MPNAPTRAYLAGPRPGSALAQACADSQRLRTALGDRYLSRPVFLEAAQAQEAGRRLSELYDLLLSLPGRLYDGDIRAFARAVGWSERQINTALSPDGTARPVPRFARSDLYMEESGFRILELNVGSPLGGFDTPLIDDVLLADPYVAAFAQDHGLDTTDTTWVLVKMLQETLPALGLGTGTAVDDGPVIGLVDWPGSFPYLRLRLTAMAELLRPYGIDAIPCHVGQVESRPDGLWVNGRRLDAVHRFYCIDDVVTAEDAALLQPIHDAAAEGRTLLFTALEPEVYGSKGCFAVLSDERNRAAFTAAELETIDRFLPWTRILREEKVHVDGALVDLIPYTKEHREELVIKATGSHGGLDVLLGWETDRAQWERTLDSCAGRPYIVQRRVRPVAEAFPVGDDTESTQPMVLNWGVFLAGYGYGGAFIRGTTDLQGGVISQANGAAMGTCFHGSLERS